MHKLKKVLIISATTILIIVAIAILFISPLTKYLIEKYDEEYTGRKITLDRAYVNPFTGYIHFSNFKIYEAKSDSIFFSATGVSANIEMHKLFSETYEISELVLDHPYGIIIQNKNDLNFDDIIERFTPKENPGPKKDPVRFSILSIKVNDGEIYYREELIPINYFVKHVAIESSGIQWNADTIAAKFSLLPGTGTGDMKGNFTINTNNLNYRLAVITHKLDLNIIQQYMKDLTNYGNFSANLDANIKAIGNFHDKETISAKGMLAINNFHFGKKPKEDYASFEKLALVILELNPKNYQYFYDSVLLSRPYLKYELYDHLDNLQTIFGKNESNVSAVNADPEKFNLAIEIVNYIRDVSKNFFQSNYKINRLRVSNGDLKFNDFSISEKFSIDLDPLFITADSIDKSHKRAKVILKSGIKPYGEADITLSINPKDDGDFDMQYHLKNLPVALFNPYTIFYTSFPLDRGTIDIDGRWVARNGILKSTNHLLIIDPRVSKRIKNEDMQWKPLPLLMALIRERGNIIDYEIPITGNLKSPKFHLRDVYVDLLKNIFIKPATTPYRIQVRNNETEIEKSLALKWAMRRNTLRHNQELFIKKMADFLIENPDASIDVFPNQYTVKEKEYILFFEAKKKYFLMANHRNSKSFSEADSERVEKISIKDSFFVHCLNSQKTGGIVFTIQEKCENFVGLGLVNAKFKQLCIEREKCFMAYFRKTGVENRVKIIGEKNVVPYNGFSFYKIEYKVKLPESLINAYQRMNELNNETPRKKNFSERRENKNSL